jgi:hypothetical protein
MRIHSRPFFTEMVWREISHRGKCKWNMNVGKRTNGKRMANNINNAVNSAVSIRKKEQLKSSFTDF